VILIPCPNHVRQAQCRTDIQLQRIAAALRARFSFEFRDAMRALSLILDSLQSAALRVRRAAILWSSRDARPVEVAPLPRRLSTTEQWTRVAEVLLEAQGRAARLVDAQRGAAAQIDAATYALQRLRQEMAPALAFTLPRPGPGAPAPTAFRRDQFRRREPLAA
jgi:hypothetical protein